MGARTTEEGPWGGSWEEESHCRAGERASTASSCSPPAPPGTWPKAPGSSWQGRLGSGVPGDPGGRGRETLRCQGNRQRTLTFHHLNTGNVRCVPKAQGLAWLKITSGVPAGVAQWVERQPATRRVTSQIPDQGMCLGCGPSPVGGKREATHGCFSLTQCLPPPPERQDKTTNQNVRLAPCSGPCSTDWTCANSDPSGSLPRMS